MPIGPRRRDVLAAVACGLSSGVAGCLGNDGDGDDDAEPSGIDTPVTVTAEDHEVDGATHTIRLRFNSITESKLTDQYRPENPAPEHKYVIIHSRVSIQSARNDPVTISEQALGLDVNGENYEPFSLSGLPSVTNTVVPTAQYRAWTAFEVPAAVESGTLRSPQPYSWFDVPTAILFERDDSIPTSL